MLVEETPFRRLALCDDGIIEAQPLRTEQPRTAELLIQALDPIERLTGGVRRILSSGESKGTAETRVRCCGFRVAYPADPRIGSGLSLIATLIWLLRTPLLGEVPTACLARFRTSSTRL